MLAKEGILTTSESTALDYNKLVYYQQLLMKEKKNQQET